MQGVSLAQGLGEGGQQGGELVVSVDVRGVLLDGVLHREDGGVVAVLGVEDADALDLLDGVVDVAEDPAALAAGPEGGHRDGHPDEYRHEYQNHIQYHGIPCLEPSGTGVDEDAAVHLLGVEPAPLLEHDEGRPGRYEGRQHDQPRHESGDAVGDDEAEDGSAHRPCGPPDIAPLKAHEFKGTLEPPEEWVVWVTGISACAFHPSVA